MMDWKAKSMPIDPEKERAWKRILPWHLLVFAIYFLVFLGLYWRMQAQIPDRDQFFWNQRILSRQLLVVMGLHAAAMIVVHWKIWKDRIQRFFFEPGSPYTVALLRILICGFIFTHLIFYAPQHWLPLSALPGSARQPLPFVGWMIEMLPIDPTLYKVALALGILFSGLATFGLFTRISLLLLIPLVFYIFGVPQFYGKLSHFHFFLWFTIILAFAPRHHTWSLDGLFHRIRGGRISRRADFSHGLVLRWLTLTLVGVYFFSGVRKLYEAGLFWALSDNPVNLLRTEWLEQFQDVPWIRIDQWPLLCNFAAIGVILFELVYPFMILTPRGRRFAALEAIAFHNLNGYFLKIDFVYLKTAHIGYFEPMGILSSLRRMKRRWLAWLIVILATSTLGSLVGIVFMAPVLLVLGLIQLFWRNVPLRQRVGWLLKLRKHLSALPTSEVILRREAKWLRLSLVTGTLLIAMNWLCGAFGIHSWPFSAYPTYSFVRESTVEYGWFQPITAQGDRLDLDSEAKAIGFKKENILPMAEKIVSAWKWEPQKLEAAITNCWERWRTEVPSLQAAISAKVLIREFPLDPEAYGKLVSETYLGEMRLIKGEWQYISDSLNPKLQLPN